MDFRWLQNGDGGREFGVDNRETWMKIVVPVIITGCDLA